MSAAASSKRVRGACECPRVNSKRFERRVIEEIRTSVLTEENLHDLAQLVADEMESEAHQMLTAIEKELGDVRRAVETSGLEVAEILPRLREKQSLQENLEQTADEARAVVEERQKLLTSATSLSAYASEIGSLIDSS